MDTSIPYRNSLIKLFEAQVKKTPANLAIAFKEERITYKALNHRSNQIAYFLRSKGVRQETLVPICIDRSVEMVLWILGILKAGGAYVPLDPESPLERLNFLLNDTGASVIITNKIHGLCTSKRKIDIIKTDEENTLVKNFPIDNLQVNIEPHNLAYIIYTSGSTGKPKGVMIEHASLLNYLLNSKTKYISDNAEGSGSFIHLSYTFDGSLSAMFMPLLAGKSIVIGSKQQLEVFEDDNLWKFAPYDFIKATPAHVELLAATIRDTTDKWLTNKLVIGGEALYLSHLNVFIEKKVKVEVVNEYGPTEATVGCSTYTFKTVGNENVQNEISIGKPIDNVELYILNEHNNIVPVGVTGEICIGGAGVARGYLNRPELTAEKFINNPFSRELGARLYKTGDLGKWLQDGNLQYIGRIDDQVKLRGYRVELGEIESVINELEYISNSAVVVKKNVNNISRLNCYYIPDNTTLKAKEIELCQAQVNTWKELYESEYGKSDGDTGTDEEYNLAGWNDSFSGLAIEQQQMREWLKETVEVILNEHPQNVLEIGCGMGLIFYQLADKITRYIGTDLSQSSINQISERIGKNLRNYCNTELKISPAHMVSLESGEQIDTIIINSVAQYFPSEDYMTEVIEKGIANLKGKGRIIVGDVRDNRLLALFKARLIINKLPDSTSVKDFKWAVDQNVLKEKELCFSPEYFYRLSSLYTEITHIDIQWKQGCYINELTLYRYTVIIYVGIEAEVIEPEWVSWSALNNKHNVLDQLEQGRNLIAIKNAPNPRLWKERLFKMALHNKAINSIGDLPNYAKEEDKESLEINEIISVVKEKGYQHRLYLHEDALKVNLLIVKSSVNGFVQQPYNVKMHSGNISSANIPLFSDITVLLQKEIKSLLEQHLPKYMVPAEFIAVNKLPLTIHGKIDRSFLSDRQERGFINKSIYHPPINEVEKELVSIWQDLLAITQVGIHDNFFEIGGTSIHAARLFSIIGKKFRANLPLGLLIKAPTIEMLAGVLLHKVDTPRWSSLVPIQPYGSKPPIFCVHGGWGNVLFYRHLANHLGPDQPLYGLQVKGLNGKDKPFYKMEDMASHYLDEIRSVQPKGPYYLGGYCYGAIVAFEMARQLLQKGNEVALLANFNGVSPKYMFPGNFPTKKDISTELNISAKQSVQHGNALVKKFFYHKKKLEALNTKDILLYPIKRVQFKMRYWLRPVIRKVCFKYYRTFGFRMPDRLLTSYILSAMYKSQSTYRPGKYLGKMIVFRSPKLFEDPTLGWSTLVEGEVQTFDVPGDHPDRTYVMHEPYVKYIAEELKNILN